MKTTAVVKLAFWVLMPFTFPIITNAQKKLPNIQQTGLRAPADIKIDGLATEWNNRFQAYNSTNLINYTICNDDENLYLVIYTSDYYAINKIGQGGVSFTVSSSSDKKLRKTGDNLSVKYPLLNLSKPIGFGASLQEYKELKKDTVANEKEINNLVDRSNKKITELFKELQVHGVEETDNTIISIYNTYGIKAMASFNKHMCYTYELAIPLKYLRLPANNAMKFSYNIKLNGMPTNEEWIKAGRFPPPSVTRADNDVNHEQEYLNNPTDFWGEYTLAKK